MGFRNSDDSLYLLYEVASKQLGFITVMELAEEEGKTSLLLFSRKNSNPSALKRNAHWGEGRSPEIIDVCQKCLPNDYQRRFLVFADSRKCLILLVPTA